MEGKEDLKPEEKKLQRRIRLSARCDFCGVNELELTGSDILVATPTRGDQRLAKAHICSDCIKICFRLVLGRVRELRAMKTEVRNGR